MASSRQRCCSASTPPPRTTLQAAPRTTISSPSTITMTSRASSWRADRSRTRAVSLRGSATSSRHTISFASRASCMCLARISAKSCRASARASNTISTGPGARASPARAGSWGSSARASTAPPSRLRSRRNGDNGIVHPSTRPLPRAAQDEKEWSEPTPWSSSRAAAAGGGSKDATLVEVGAFMHLLAAAPGQISDGSTAVDLGQTAAEIVVLSAADTELACLAGAQKALVARDPAQPSLRLANLLRLKHNLSVDLYADAVIASARLVVVRLLGGRSYWPYGVDRLAEVCGERNIPLALLPGDERPDEDLARASTVPPEALQRLWRYLAEGGTANAEQFLRYGAHLCGRASHWREPQPLLRAGLYWPGETQPALEDIRRHWRPETPVAALVFYRALVQAADTDAIDALTAALAARGLNPLPVFVQSLKDPQAQAILGEVLAATAPDIVLNATGFAVSAPGGAPIPSPFAPYDCPVLQVIFASGDAERWRTGKRGLDARDVAMMVALPEVDGRIVTRAVSFKGEAQRDPLTELDLVRHTPVADRVAFVAELARNWIRLRRLPAAERRVALVLANYPNKNGRIGNGVGLDTPASVIEILRALADAGYRVEDVPADGDALMRRLLAGPTNAASHWSRDGDESFHRSDYATYFASLPRAVQAQVEERWGAPERDPLFRPSDLDCGRFAMPALRFGNVVVAIQPARGYNLDPAQAQHDPALVPPHGYLAFHAWLSDGFRAHAVVHVGKHGNLEWLPGKAVALSAECFPEAALGPLPHLYPFIVNDPGEGTQAKRRAQAVIIDHLTPPLTRAGSYGVLAELERLIDEYYDAARGDPRRLAPLAADIVERARAAGLDRDCGIAADDDIAAALKKLDGFLCELKDLQIRDGLHVFGASPEGERRDGLLAAFARPRRGAAPEDESLLRALAADLGLAADPLALDPGESRGTVERLEALARRLIAGAEPPPGPRSRAVLGWIEKTLRPALAACGAAEIAGLLAGLDGGFVAPGPSGAPSRGRPEVLPTGRNFYSVDTRAVPTPAAWQLGWHAAGLAVERYAQDHGDYPRHIAMSAWGTANMRTGGDDIAQALALIGVRPVWEPASGRVSGFEILPDSVLDRPRVDVTLRISGFFRDAFPGLVDLFDSAARAVAARENWPDEPRIFGAKPGAYGAGLQTPIDEGVWESERDLAETWLAWSRWAYSAGGRAQDARGAIERRLARADAVMHNQDNREHDLLDSDDYYQFEGGLALVVRHLSGRAPAVYHNDHSQPERPRIRTLREEIGRVVRGRAANPRWIAGVMRHGYKGAAEIAATVDYLFAFAATARAVDDAHFDALYDAYLGDAAVRDFIASHNPAALAEITARFEEAVARGLWHPRRNR